MYRTDSIPALFVGTTTNVCRNPLLWMLFATGCLITLTKVETSEDLTLETEKCSSVGVMVDFLTEILVLL